MEGFGMSRRSSKPYEDTISQEDLRSQSAEDIFQRLLKKGNGGTTVRTASSPALSTRFVRSLEEVQATTNQKGALAKIHYPSTREVYMKHLHNHGDDLDLGYFQNMASGAYNAGYGEKAAQALAKEDNTYQLKGTFPAAALNFTKLRARVEARDGDVEAIDKIFAAMWGISSDEACSLPRLHLRGSEATRMSAMEDRAYHSLAGHPGNHGGYRVDMATIAPDALGDNIPLNWPQIRTGLKAIALMQLQGDAQMQAIIHEARIQQSVSFCMSLVQGSTPAYVRAEPWEKLMVILLNPTEDNIHKTAIEQDDPIEGMSTALSFPAANQIKILEEEEFHIGHEVNTIAQIVTKASTMALHKTVEIILSTQEERATLAEYNDDTYADLAESRMSVSFSVPKYKLRKDSMYYAKTQSSLPRERLPDSTSHGPSSTILDLAEFREANLSLRMDIPGALHLAVFMTIMSPMIASHAYLLMFRVKAPDDAQGTKIAQKLRREDIYNDEEVRELGKYLFGDTLVNNFNLLLRNIVPSAEFTPASVKQSLWKYLNARCNQRRACPCLGDWRDLMYQLRDLPEGWTLYYWARITIGRRHYEMTNGLMLPMSAGVETDFLTVMKKSALSKAKFWSQHYSAAYKDIEKNLEAKRTQNMEIRKRLADEEKGIMPSKYVPPHLRQQIDLEHMFDAEAILERNGKYTAEQYMRMVEMQSKSKFFAMIEVFSSNSRIAVGITDANMLKLLVDFYHARWYSLDLRIKKALENNKSFWLGIYEFKAHPWGELVTDLPQTYPEMLEFVSSLDERAWTIDPQFLQSKLRKALNELWDDIRREIGSVMTYIYEVHDGIAEEQEEAIAASRVDGVMASTLGVPAIPIKTFGYTAPYARPARQMAVMHDENTVMVQQSQGTFMADKQQQMDIDDGDDFGLDDPDEEALLTLADTIAGSSLSNELSGDNGELYASLRAIWSALGLPEVEDEVMRVAIGVPAGTDLDKPHLDDQTGPLMLLEEMQKVGRMWQRKITMIQHRLGIAQSAEYEKDM